MKTPEAMSENHQTFSSLFPFNPALSDIKLIQCKALSDLALAFLNHTISCHLTHFPSIPG